MLGIVENSIVVHLAKYFDLCVNDGNHLVMYYVISIFNVFFGLK
jgi:hypothetical protein